MRKSSRSSGGFEREAQATAALSSPNTVELHEFGVTSEGTLYYVMELLRGLDLQNLVEKHGPVPYPRILYFLRQVCESLAEAHHNGLVHRDIKPANIYICRVGLQCDFVKVLDFGLVKLNRGEGAQTQLTAANTAAGTPAFMAPEIALGEPTIDGRADLYALGCVAYWLLTGRYVFEGNNAMKVVLAHVNEAPVPPSQQTELEVPAALDQLILECLEKKRENRPPSAADVLERLAAVNDSDSWDRDRAASWWRTHLPEMMA